MNFFLVCDSLKRIRYFLWVRYFNCCIYNVVHMDEKKLKPVIEGTFRIKSKDLGVYEKTRGSWKKSSRLFPEAMRVIELFVAHDNLEYLIDKKCLKFLKGQLSVDGKVQGARIDVLPDGRKLDKAYSLFAEHLTIHDETSNDHWDVLYRNPCGNYSYVYTIEKRNLSGVMFCLLWGIRETLLRFLCILCLGLI